MNTATATRVRRAAAALRDRHRRLVMIGAPLALLGVPLLVIAGLAWALHDPASSVDRVPAAVVNNDQPVTVDGQLVPLGRELTAQLVDHPGASYDWTLTSAADAAAGLDSGRYRVAVTIPADFSRAATSAQQGPDAARQAVISVAAAKDAPLTDAAVGAELVDQTRAALGHEVTRTYLENVYIELAGMHARMTTAVDGAAQLKDGAARLAAGATQLTAGARSLTSGLDRLSSGSAALATGADQVAAGAGSLHTGATRLASGADQVAAGNRQLAGTVDPIAGKIVTAIDTAPDPTVAARQLAQAAADCTAPGGDPTFCSRLKTISAQISQQAGHLNTTLHTTRTRVVAFRTGIDRLAVGSQQVADGTRTLASSSGRLASGARQVASGADQVHQGAVTAAAGSRRLTSGADALSTGDTSLAAGARKLHDGLAAAQQQIPDYTKTQGSHLAGVVSNPITAAERTYHRYTQQAMTLFAMIALWVAAMTTFTLFPAIPATTLRSFRPTWRLALTGVLEPGLLGTIAAAAVATAVAAVVHAGLSRSLLLVLAAAATAATFRLLIQAAAATLPRQWQPVSVTVLVLAVATSITSAQPPVLQTLGNLLPTAAGTSAIRAAIDGSGSALLRAALMLAAWFTIGLIVAMVQTERARTASVGELERSARLRQPVRA